MTERPTLRITIELVDHAIHVELDMTEAEKAEALGACPELPRVLNDSMAALRRKYTGTKLALHGEEQRSALAAIAEELLHGILRRAPELDCEVQAIYHTETRVTQRRDVATGRLF